MLGDEALPRRRTYREAARAASVPGPDAATGTTGAKS
jgi:hypothetical protein